MIKVVKNSRETSSSCRIAIGILNTRKGKMKIEEGCGSEWGAWRGYSSPIFRAICMEFPFLRIYLQFLKFLNFKNSQFVWNFHFLRIYNS